MPRIPFLALALALLLAGCNMVQNAVDETLAENAPATAEPGPEGQTGRPHCEVFNGPQGCRGTADMRTAAPAPAGAPAAPTAQAPAGRRPFTPVDCTRTGWSGVALAYGNIGRMNELSAYCRAIEAAQAAPAPVAPPSSAGGCTMTPTCRAELAARDRLLARYNVEMAGRGVGAQAGYAWCAATETERAARACAASLRAVGQHACAAQVEASAEGARRSAQDALTTGRQVGIDAARAMACR